MTIEIDYYQEGWGSLICTSEGTLTLNLHTPKLGNVTGTWERRETCPNQESAVWPTSTVSGTYDEAGTLDVLTASGQWDGWHIQATVTGDQLTGSITSLLYDGFQHRYRGALTGHR
jgi:hypothetical protein